MSVSSQTEDVGGGALPTLALPAAEREVRDLVRDTVAQHVAPRAAEVDADSIFPDAGLRALAQAGLAGLLMPEHLGGSGHSTLAYVVAMEEIASACGSTSTLYMTQMHSAYPILIAGEEAQRSRWIPSLCDGSALGSLAVTEPAAGSDVAAMRTTARRDGRGYVISGTKTFITTGNRADVIVLFASLDTTAGRDGITAFLIERGTPGLVAGPPMHKLGMRGSCTAELFLDTCHVSADCRLGPEGGGWALSMQSVVKSRLSAAAQGVGLARGALEAAIRWASNQGLTRGSRGRAQDVQFTLAEASARVAAARALLHGAAQLADTGGGDLVPTISMAKLMCTDCAMDVASKMVDLLAEEGDLVEHGVERFLRDAKVTQIYDGTNQIQRLLIARSLPSPTEALDGH